MTPSPDPAPDLDQARPLGDIVLRPVRGHAFESCVEQLATAIRLGVFAYGAALPPERELAERMGVARATLREAIAGLRAAGMVRTTRGRGGGTVVAYRPTAPGEPRPDGGIAERREELLDSLVFRRVVEPGACHLAASRELSASERMLLTTALAAVDGAADPAEHRQADSRLHLAIAGVTGSPRTVAAVTDVQACLHDMLQAIPVLDVNIEHSGAQHRAIVTAILGGDPTRARRAMEQHCDDTAALLRGLLG
ncbi:FadR/GntR family transcriptional regulator [Nocardioides nitrophenolicus]|uniref:FadR/GntR family transcriptional regulator n=1 Tax=Nocardioides nitrophenolicus TaxID=60489 RepID=UPI0019581CDF|nr:FCD domain-containing protein [Nocardioides nitrophenolicus]MBM7515994.1 GntR family transcriptional repressor for pyruvate dehydrogenase complex [Nocardioides nitrophenolicus]